MDTNFSIDFPASIQFISRLIVLNKCPGVQPVRIGVMRYYEMLLEEVSSRAFNRH